MSSSLSPAITSFWPDDVIIEALLGWHWSLLQWYVKDWNDEDDDDDEDEDDADDAILDPGPDRVVVGDNQKTIVFFTFE